VSITLNHDLRTSTKQVKNDCILRFKCCLFCYLNQNQWRF